MCIVRYERPYFLRSLLSVSLLPGAFALHGCADVAPESNEDDVTETVDDVTETIDDEGMLDGEEETTQETEVEVSIAEAKQAWTRCASAFGDCSFNGRRDVRMRATNGRSVTNSFYQSARCATGPGGFKKDPAPGVAKFCEYGALKVRRLPAPDKAMGPYIDRTKIPVGSTGYSTVRIQRSPMTPRADSVGAFRTVCSLSHMNYDDPLVFPGNSGAAHLHAFFGNTRTSAASDSRSLETLGNSTCRGGTANRSAYWVPALIDTRNGRPVIPFEGHFYYKTGYNGIAPARVGPMPRGLRMIAGRATSSRPQRDVWWSCVNGDNTGYASIRNCGVGQQLQMSIRFPQCWNGRDLDSADHRSHMAYPSEGRCPASHPRAIPEITFNIRYKVEEANAPRRWRLSSDMYDKSIPGGYSGHGDWWDGWAEGVMHSWIRGCLQRSRDCYSNLLGDGREMY